MKYFGFRAWMGRLRWLLCPMFLLTVLINMLWRHLSANGIFDYIDFSKSDGIFWISLFLAAQTMLLGGLICAGRGNSGRTWFAALVDALHLTYWTRNALRLLPASYWRQIVSEGMIPCRTSVLIRGIAAVNLVVGLGLAVWLLLPRLSWDRKEKRI